ncbi:MAG TPA: hypothetical protein VEL69_03985 [Ktedonobacteraceae bacterium]|nr:hypothetical protein [Ktedonobacteraceae bacterium]
MRAAAVALVLIVGAAVVLWYGNTLNSWVLGGLIGGLAALLLSIPISLVLFSYFSRRHDEQLRAEVQEEMSLAQILEYPEDVYESEVDMLPPAEYEQRDFRPSTGRQFVPPYPLLPAPRQNQQTTSENHASRQRTTEYPLQAARQPKSAPLAPVNRGNPNVIPPRRPNTARQARNPGFNGYQPSSPRGMHQTAALRAARQEAAQQYDDFEVIPSASKRSSVVRPAQNQAPQQGRPRVQRPAQKLQPQAPRETYDRTREQQTDQPGRRAPQTDQFQPRTGPIARNPQLEAQRRDPDNITENLKRPLQRRAPYMYDDDPLRQELAQQIDVPSIQRRASRFEDEEDQD